jgi:hypothetical protein
MKTFNVTANVYETRDIHKQTILLNREVHSVSEEGAKSRFEHYHLPPHYTLIKIYSVEEIPQNTA